MTQEAPPDNEDFRMGDDGYPEPPIDGLQGISQTEADAMRRAQTYADAQAKGRERGALLAKEEALRQRYARDGFPDAATKIQADQERRREQS